MQKLKGSEVSSFRTEQLVAQAGHCALCGERIEVGEVAVLDHDHKTGHVRAVVHRGCNAMLGVIENNRPRYELRGGRLRRFLAGVFDYVHRDYSSMPLHPTHRTADEKRVLTNKRARVARAKKKASE